MEVDAPEVKIDEGLYSRQLYVMGREGQRRMAGANVLICGVNGLGAEVAKNIILAGVKGVTLFDPSPVEWRDVGANPYVCEADVGGGASRAECAAPRLSELNPYVSVSVARAGSLHSSDEAEWAQRARGHSVVVMCDAATDAEMVACDAACRACGAVFVASECRGACSQVFCDFGDEWHVADADGEPGASCLITSITQSNPALVTVVDEQRHGLEVGDVVTIASCVGMEAVNDRKWEVTRVCSPYAYEIAFDSTQAPSFISSGYATHVKKGACVRHRSCAAALEEPGEFLVADWAKDGRPQTLHASFRALRKWRLANALKLPLPGSAECAADVSKNLATDGLSEAEQAVCGSLALTAWGEIAPLTSFLGGVVGQEVLKACSGKFAPISQWFYFDALEALPDAGTAVDRVPRGDRDDSLRAVFGAEVCAKLGAQRYFLVGAGAIGCEMLKNWALMGVGQGALGGEIVITDMDRIEKSNLSRQLLFRAADINSAKSTCAARAATALNPKLRVTAHEQRVGPDTEVFFDDSFYSGLDGVCTALDNVDARLYMDSRCLAYHLPMLESGTLGTKGNTQVVAPRLTEPYGATRDPPEKSIPVCTLKNFPNRIEHTLQWARDWFEGAFTQSVADVNSYLTSGASGAFALALNAQPNTKLETLRRVKTALVDSRPATFEDCVVWARLQFEECFHNSIAQLLHNFPPDQVTAQGVPFWSGAKRAPVALCFDARDALHLEYVRSCASLRASNYGINCDCAETRSDDVLRVALDRVIVPDFAPRDGVRISANEAEEKSAAAKAGVDPMLLDDVDAMCDQLLRQLPSPASLAGMRLEPCEFEKDDDTHMAFVAACSNMRARNYKIPEADTHQSRLIAGKIIPAIATTTALVAGLVCLELLKVVQNKPLEHLKSAFVNLALPLFAFSEPQPPKATVAKIPGGRRAGEEWAWTAWDCIEIDTPNMTLKQLIDFFTDEFGLEVSMLSHGVSILFSSFANAKKVKERMPMKLTDVVTLVTKKQVPPNKRFVNFDVMLQDDDMEEVELPYLRLKMF